MAVASPGEYARFFSIQMILSQMRMGFKCIHDGMYNGNERLYLEMFRNYAESDRLPAV